MLSVRFSEDATEITYRDKEEGSAAYFTHSVSLDRLHYEAAIDHIEKETAALLTSILGEISISPTPRPVQVRPSLTAREEEVLVALASGDSMPNMAKHLYISVSTVKCHITALHRKFSTHNRTQLVMAAVRFGFAPL